MSAFSCVYVLVLVAWLLWEPVVAQPRNVYQILGVSPTASADAIRSKFRFWARTLHPDSLPSSASDAEREKARRQFLEISEAYEVLSNPQKRKQFDSNRAVPSTPQQREYLQHNLFDEFEAGVTPTSNELMEMLRNSSTVTYAIFFWSTRTADCVPAGLAWKETALRLLGTPHVVMGAYRCDQSYSACNNLPIRRVPSILVFHKGNTVAFRPHSDSPAAFEAQLLLEFVSSYIPLPASAVLSHGPTTTMFEHCPAQRFTLYHYSQTVLQTNHYPFVSFEYTACYDCIREARIAVSSLLAAFPHAVRHDRVACSTYQGDDAELEEEDFAVVCRKYTTWKTNVAWVFASIRVTSYLTVSTTAPSKVKEGNTSANATTSRKKTPLRHPKVFSKNEVQATEHPITKHRAAAYRDAIMHAWRERSMLKWTVDKEFAPKIPVQNGSLVASLTSTDALLFLLPLVPNATVATCDILMLLSTHRLLRDVAFLQRLQYPSEPEARVRIHVLRFGEYTNEALHIDPELADKLQDHASKSCIALLLFPFGWKAKAKPPILVPYTSLHSYETLSEFLLSEVNPLRLYQLGADYFEKVLADPTSSSNPRQAATGGKAVVSTRGGKVRPWFILFNAGAWCPPCQYVKPIWRLFARVMQNKKMKEGGTIRIAQIDCDVHRSVCAREKIDGYPTMVFRQGTNIYRVFEGTVRYAHDVERLVDFALSSWNNYVLQPSPRELLQFADTHQRRSNVQPYLISFTGGTWCPPCNQLKGTFKALAQQVQRSTKYRNVLRIGEVDCDDQQPLCNRFHVDGVPTVIFFYPTSETVKAVMPATSDRSLNPVIKFIQRYLPDFS